MTVAMPLSVSAPGAPVAPSSDAEPGWDLYRTFLGVLEAGSLSGAARSLGLAQPTAGRHVEALEAALGCTLFTRSPHGLRPTDMALALAPHARSLRSAAGALRRVAASQGHAVRGVVRVSASEVMAVEVLPPVLAELRRRHPGLVLEVVASNSPADLLQRDVDIAVRMGRPTQEALLARRIGAVDCGLYARRSYLAAHGTPATLDDLAAHSIIGFDRETVLARSLRERVGPVARRRLFALRSDSDLLQIAAVRAGFGIGVCQVPLARRDNRLARVLEREFSLSLETWVAMHEDLRDSARCKAVFEAMAEGLRAHVST
jgi:DNA-binding transcriptional LysR family regulator